MYLDILVRPQKNLPRLRLGNAFFHQTTENGLCLFTKHITVRDCIFDEYIKKDDAFEQIKTVKKFMRAGNKGFKFYYRLNKNGEDFFKNLSYLMPYKIIFYKDDDLELSESQFKNIQIDFLSNGLWLETPCGYKILSS